MTPGRALRILNEQPRAPMSDVEALEQHRKQIAQVRETAALRGRLDSVKQWLDTHCREGEGEKLQSSVAHKDYVRFCKASKRPAGGAVAFKAALTQKGIQSGRRGPHNVLIGIRLICT